MKVNFTPEIPFTPEFNGNKDLVAPDQIVVKLKPMTLLDLLDLTDTLRSAGMEKVDMKDLSTDQMKTLISQGGKYIPKYCTFIAGNDGFDMEQVCAYVAFAALATELLFALINNSAPTKADEKN